MRKFHINGLTIEIDYDNNTYHVQYEDNEMRDMVITKGEVKMEMENLDNPGMVVQFGMDVTSFARFLLNASLETIDLINRRNGGA